MEIREKTINGNKWQLINETWENYYAWGHKTTILRNGANWVSHKVRYYNRTWECYTYETCMRGAVEEIREQALYNYIHNYKVRNGITRFKRGQKEEVINAFKESDFARELDALKESIKNRDFD